MTQVKVESILDYLMENKIQYSYAGGKEIIIEGFSPLSQYKEHTITWIKTKEHICKTINKICLCIAPDDCVIEAEGIIYTSNPKMVFFSILQHFFQSHKNGEIAEDAVIETNRLGRDVTVGHFCYIGKDVIIEDNVTIGNNVQIECPALIGEGTIIGSGVVIGTDGFGYYKDLNGRNIRVPHFGGVTIGKYVEIGANTCIDRGTMEDTEIGNYVRIDNLCHIAHNVKIGENSMVIALSLLGGSSCLEKNTYVAPGAIIKNQVTVGENGFIGMGAVVLDDVMSDSVVVGVPARKIR